MKVLKNAKFTGNIKINDTNTDIYFQAYDDGVLQKLNAGQCSFRIKNDTGYLITISNVSTETDYITFKSNELKPLPVGTYYLELWVEDGTGTYIYPDESFCKLRINENVTVAQGTTIPTISLEEYENKLQGYVDNAVADGKTEIKDDFDKYVDSITDSTIATATKASQDAATAINTANSANSAAQNATNIANAAKSNADSASQAAATAQSTANTVKSIADSATGIANNANSNASLAISTANTAINQRVGGRNLLLDSEKHQSSQWFVNYNINTANNGSFMNSNIYKVNSSWQGLKYNITDLISRGLLVLGEKYTFSLYIKVDNGIVLSSKNLYFYGADGTFSTGTIDYSRINSDTFTQISATVTCQSITAPSSGKNQFGFETSSSFDGYIYMACPQFEKGDKATDYTPAPEDIESQIAELRSQIQTSQVQ